MSSTEVSFQIAGPTLLAIALKGVMIPEGTPAFTCDDVGKALRAPGVYPLLSARQLAKVLFSPGVFTGLSRDEMAGALVVAGFDASEARGAIADAFDILVQLKLVEARASSELADSYNGQPQTAARLIEGPNEAGIFWNSAIDGSDPTPWFWVKLEQTSIVTHLTIRWKSNDGDVGARPMKYTVSSSVDGIAWSETGMNETAVTGLSAQKGTDVLPGWTTPTRFIKIAMSESSYTSEQAYFTCHYVVVSGVAMP